MGYRLDFDHLLNYNTLQQGITVPIKLSPGQSSVEIFAKLDCGASNCVFEYTHGETLGIEVERGDLKRFNTATGHFDAFGRSVTMVVKSYEFEVMVYFAKDESFNRNVLGRIGFFDRLLVGLNDYSGKLYLNRMDNILDNE